MKKLTLRTIEAGTYSLGHHMDRLDSSKAKIVVLSAVDKVAALAAGKKEWRKQYDPAGFYRVYGEHAKVGS